MESDIALRIDAMNLKNRRRDVETNCRNRLHDLAPPNRGRLNSTHIRGTHVPVEEVAVGTEIALRPPHRSRRALLTHRAPTLDGDEEPLFGPRVQDAWEWQVPVSDLLHSRPRKSTSLASTHQRAVPTFDHVMPEC